MGCRVGRYRDDVRLPVPDPRPLLELVPNAFALVGQAGELLTSAQALLGRVDALLDRIEETRQAADRVIVRTAGTVGSVEPTLERAADLVARAERLLDTLGPSLEKLEPTLRTLAGTTDEDEVAALVSLLDHLPHLVTALDEDILPILASLDTVGPDIHRLLETTQDLVTMMAKVPGLRRLRRED